MDDLLLLHSDLWKLLWREREKEGKKERERIIGGK